MENQKSERLKLIVCTEDQLDRILSKILDKHDKRKILLNEDDVNGNDLLTRKEAAQLLKISLPGLYPLIKNGTIKPIKIGGSVRFRKSQILEAVV